MCGACRLETTWPEALELKQAMPALLLGTESTFEGVARRLAELNAGIDAVRTQATAADRVAAAAHAAAAALAIAEATEQAAGEVDSAGPPSAGDTASVAAAPSGVPSLLLGAASRGSCVSVGCARLPLCAACMSLEPPRAVTLCHTPSHNVDVPANLRG